MITPHKIWQAGTVTLLLLISCQLVMNGFFKPKLNLNNHSEPFGQASKSDRKVIMLLVDALREDFVEFDTNDNLYLDQEASYAYKGKKLTYFKELKEKQPDNVILQPLASESPTVTVVRIKGMLSGGLTTFFDTSEEFFSGEVQEDNILWQLKHKQYNRGAEPSKIAFYGDYIWDPLFG